MPSATDGSATNDSAHGAPADLTAIDALRADLAETREEMKQLRELMSRDP